MPTPRRALFAAALCLAAGLPASDDWLSLPVGRRLDRAWDLGLTLHQAQQETWGLGDGFAWMRDADGAAKERRVVEGELQLRRQLGGASLTLAVPGVMAEMEPFSAPGTASYPRLDDAYARWGTGLGDLRVGLRWDAPNHDAWDLMLDAEGTAPSGMGPFQATHPLVATGNGRWALRAGFGAGLRAGAWQLRLSAHGGLQFGRSEDVNPAAPLAYDAAGPVYAPAAGAVWLDERWGGDAALGLGWDWHVDEGSRHSLAVALVAVQQGTLRVDGIGVPGTEAQGLAAQPELHARFGAFSALGGWRSAWLWARGLPAPDFGELFLRLDHAL